MLAVIIIFFNLKKILFIYFGCIGFLLLCMGFLQLWLAGGFSSLQCTDFLLQRLLLLRSTGSRCTGFSSCGTWAQQLWLAGSSAQAQQLWRTGLVALRHVGSSWTRAQTRVPCISRQILNHCATREVPVLIILIVVIPAQGGSVTGPWSLVPGYEVIIA